jgi:hypothetical protein
MLDDHTQYAAAMKEIANILLEFIPKSKLHSEISPRRQRRRARVYAGLMMGEGGSPCPLMTMGVSLAVSHASDTPL